MANLQEIWRSVKGYESLYRISNLGRVKSLPRLKISGAAGVIKTKEKMLTPCINSAGYYLVVLCNHETKKKTSCFIHRLIMDAFVENPKNYPCINHIDGNKQNNDLNNLEWCSFAHNNKHAYFSGLSIGRAKMVRQICKHSGKVLAVYDSAKIAEYKTGIKRSCICAAISGKRGVKTAGGYRWQFT